MAVYTVVSRYLSKTDIGRFWRQEMVLDQRFYRAGLSKAIGLLGDQRGSGARQAGLQAPLVPFQRYRPPAYGSGRRGVGKLAYLCSVERCGALQTGEDRMSAPYRAVGARTVNCHSFSGSKTVEFFEAGGLVMTFGMMTPEEADDAIWLWLQDGILPYGN